MSRPRLDIRLAMRLAGVAARSVAAGHVLMVYGYSWSGTEGASMLPTFEVMGTSVLVSSRHRHGRGVQVGDLVTYDIPILHNAIGLKRVIGMPGDYVAMQTPMTTYGGGDDMMQVPQGHCWIEGDNLTISRDSRDFGPVPLGLVRGKVLAKLNPFERVENGLTKVE